MSFTRTASGVANYSFFHGADVVVYTEGKNLDQLSNNLMLDDERFYTPILNHILPGKTIKIKCVGNKDAALSYAEIIQENSIKNALVFVDRDFAGLTHSILKNKCVIQTHGYSWENDLWTEASCLKILGLLTQGSLQNFKLRFKNLTRRMKVIGILDATLQLSNSAIISKKSSLGGIDFDFSSNQPISCIEIKRLVALYRIRVGEFCDVCRQVSLKATKMTTSMLAQGHVWSNAVRALIGRIYREMTGEIAPSKRAFLNIALSGMEEQLNAFLGRATIAHYRKHIRLALAD